MSNELQNTRHPESLQNDARRPSPFEIDEYTPTALHEINLLSIAMRLSSDGDIDEIEEYRQQVFGMPQEVRQKHDQALSYSLIERERLDANFQPPPPPPKSPIDQSIEDEAALVESGYIDPRQVAHRAPAEFPLHVFPQWVQDMVISESAAIQVAQDLPAAVALGCLSTVCNYRDFKIKVGPGQVETINLYLVIALPPGAGKSPVFNRMRKPLEDIGGQLEKMSTKERAAAKARKFRLKKQLETAERFAVADNADAKAIEAHASAQLEYDQCEVHEQNYQLSIDADVTPEAFVSQLHVNGGTLAVLSAEGGLFSSLGRYTKQGVDPNLDGVLNAWDGSPVGVTRKGSPSFKIPSARAVMAFTVQPIVMRKIMGDSLMQGRGLVDRFMCVEPQSYVGYRNYIDQISRDESACHEWDERIKKLGNVEFKGSLLLMSDDASAVLARWRQDAENKLREDGDLFDLRGLVSKVYSSVIRTAGLLHVAHGYSEREPISVVTMANAIEVGDYWLDHALRVLSITHGDHTIEGCQKVLAWLNAKGGRVTRREISQGGCVRRSHPGKMLDELLAKMLEMRWIDTTDPHDWKTYKPGMPAPEFWVMDHVPVDNDSDALGLPTLARRARQGLTESEEDYGESTSVTRSCTTRLTVENAEFSVIPDLEPISDDFPENARVSTPPPETEQPFDSRDELSTDDLEGVNRGSNIDPATGFRYSSIDDLLS